MGTLFENLKTEEKSDSDADLKILAEIIVAQIMRGHYINLKPNTNDPPKEKAEPKS